MKKEWVPCGGDGTWPDGRCWDFNREASDGWGWILRTQSADFVHASAYRNGNYIETKHDTMRQAALWVESQCR